MNELGVDIARFEQRPSNVIFFALALGLSRGVFFPRETFGRDILVTGDPMTMVSDDIAPDRRNGKPVREFIAQFPVSARSKAELIALYESSTDPLPRKSVDEKLNLLKQVSYRDYLVKICGYGEEVANCFQGRTLDFFALGCDSVAAADAREAGYPGFGGLGLSEASNPDLDEPYIYHFPDGNASLGAAAGACPHSGRSLRHHDGRRRAGAVRLCQARRRGKLCARAARQHLRERPQRGRWGGTSPICARASCIRVAGTHAVLACFNMVIPHIMPELPAAQRAALAQNVKAPLVYSKVLVRNWQPWAKLGVHDTDLRADVVP